MDKNTLNMNISIINLILKSMKDDNKLCHLFKEEFKAFFETYNIFDSFLLEQIERIKFINNNCSEEDRIMVNHYRRGYVQTIDAIIIFKDSLYFSKDFTYSKLYINEDRLIKQLSDFEKQLIDKDLIKFSKEETTTNKRKRL